MGTLIGIRVEFQCRADLRAVEATVLQESGLTRSFDVITRQLGTEALGAHGANRREPVDVGRAQDAVGLVVRNATLRELSEDRRHDVVGKAARRELTRKLSTAVLAPREELERGTRASSLVDGGASRLDDVRLGAPHPPPRLLPRRQAP